MTNQVENLFKRIGEQIEHVVDGNEAVDDAKKIVSAITQSGLSKLDLVSREEFDAQAAVLAKTRAKLEALEQELKALKKQ